MLQVIGKNSGNEYLRLRSMECLEDLIRLHSSGCLYYPCHFFIGSRNFQIRKPGEIYMEDINCDYSIPVNLKMGNNLLFNI